MSTLEGQSALQPLHSRHRSRASCSSGLVKASLGKSPLMAERSRLARPRVECFSSSVTIYEGHIVPDRRLRHSPLPLHISMARSKPPSFSKEKCVLTGMEV